MKESRHWHIIRCHRWCNCEDCQDAKAEYGRLEYRDNPDGEEDQEEEEEDDEVPKV